MQKKVVELLKTILKIGVTIGVIYWIIQKLGFEKIVETVKSADPIWLIIGTIIFVVSIILGALQWRSLLQSRGVELPLGKTLGVYFTGIFFNNFMLGMVAGDSYKVAHLHINEGKAEGGFAATFYDRIAGLLVISMFALVGGIYLFATKAGVETVSSTAEAAPAVDVNSMSALMSFLESANMNSVLIIILFFAAIMGTAIALLISKRLQKLAMKITDKIPHEKIRDQLQSVLQPLFIDRHDAAERKTFLIVLIYSFWIQLLRVTVHIMAAASLGLFSWGSVHYFFIIIPIISFLTIIPLPFGIKETIGGSLFLGAGFPLDSAVVMQFLATLMGIAGSLFGGITFILDKRKEKAVEA